MIEPDYSTPEFLPPSWRRRLAMGDDQACLCGCGQTTPRATRSRKERGLVKGQPLRYCYGHFTGPESGRNAHPCDPETLVECAGKGCGGKTHRATWSACDQGHPAHGGRGLCGPCHFKASRDGTLIDYPRSVHRADDVLDEWAELGPLGVGFHQFAERIGRKFATWERMFLRAKAAGDPRAVRFDRGERAA